MSVSGRRVFIGDVQGCAEELIALLELLQLDQGRDQLWFTGDLVNRGPDNLGVLRTVVELEANTVLGNHDLHLLRTAAGERKASPRDTFQDVLNAPDRDPLLSWLRRRPLVHQWPDLTLVHAGLHPAWDDPLHIAAPLEEQIAAGQVPWDDPDLRFLVQARHCDADGTRPRDDVAPPPPFRPWDAFYSGERTVVFGHWAMRKRVSERRVRGLDSGCVWGGELTAWIAEEDRFVAVPARRAHQIPRGAD